MDDNITNFQQTEPAIPTWLVLLTATALIAGYYKCALQQKHHPKKELPVPPVEKVGPDAKSLDLSPIKKLALPIACCTQPSLPSSVEEIKQQPTQKAKPTQPAPSRIKPIQNLHYFDSKPIDMPQTTNRVAHQATTQTSIIRWG